MSYWLSVLWEHPFLSLLCLYIAYRVLDTLKRVPRISGLTGKHVLITGCDSGFGHKLAQDLDALGMQVFAACYTDTGESELKKKCSGRLKTLHLDVTKDDSIQKAFEFVKSNLKGKGLWALVNNAGVCSGMGPMEWLRREHYQQVMEVNVFGMVEMTRVFLPLLKRAKGRVVNTASVLGRFSLPGAVPYSISKYGVEAFSDGIRLELKAFGVKVCILEPGFHATNMTEPDLVGKAVRRLFKEAPREIQDEYGEEFLNLYVEKSVRLILGGVTSPGLQDVVDAYTHAVTSRYPRGRYTVGTDANLFWIPLSYMPAWLTDTLLGTAIRRNKPAAIRNRKYD